MSYWLSRDRLIATQRESEVVTQFAPRRIHITGGPGTGKTTLARRLGAMLNLPVYELDTIAFEGRDYRPKTRDQRLDAVHKIASGTEWITEGIFLGWTDELLDAADVIIWMDHLPWHMAFTRLLGRFVQGGLSEVSHQPGTRKFTRFTDYQRHLRHLVSVFVSSRTYYRPGLRADLEDHRMLTRSTAAQELSRHTVKIIHCSRPEDVEMVSWRLTLPADLQCLARNPLASIVVNNYNYDRFLAVSIDSALNQRYPNTEIVVVDDGSTDNSRAIIAAYGDRVIRVLKENGGQASAFNAGFVHSHGDVIIFLDADDALLPYTVTHIMDAFAATPNVAKVQYRMEIIDDHGIATGQIQPATHLRMLNGDLRRYVLSFPEDMTWMATSGNAFARSVLSQFFPMPESAYDAGGADWYLSHLSPLLGNVVSLDLVGAYYRVHTRNLYHRSTLDLDQIRRTIHYMRATRQLLRQFALSHHRLAPESTYLDVPGDSISFVAHRLISLKLEPTFHPIDDDSLWHLLIRGLMAAHHRFDVRFPMKVLYGLWFTLIAIAPHRLATFLANVFLYPDRRHGLNRLLGTFHRIRVSR